MQWLISNTLALFKIVYQVILKVTHFIGRINSFFLLTVFYFVFLGVAKITFVLTGKDPLGLRFDKGHAQTYWKRRKDFIVDRKSFLEPY